MRIKRPRGCHVSILKMEGKKRAAAALTPAPEPKKPRRQISIGTFEKWQGQWNRDHLTLSWLRCEKDRSDRGLVDLIWCEACRKYESRICSSKNFSKVSLIAICPSFTR